MLAGERLDWISGGEWRLDGSVGKRPSVWPVEADAFVGTSAGSPVPSSHCSISSLRVPIPYELDSEAFLMNSPMVMPTEEDEVVETGLATIGPVYDVVCVAEAEPTAREAAGSVPVIERPPDRGR